MTSGQPPFSIAVTGHRDLRPEDLPALCREVTTIFESIRSRVPGRPLTLLTGLAEGADQLVAEVAQQNGVLLTAVIPMPLDIYAAQLPPQAQQQLETLYAGANSIFRLPLDGRTPEQLKNSETARAECYESLAIYLVQHCQALIALWDGRRSDKVGGTCRVVNYARFGCDPAGAQHIESHCEVVYHVMTPRLSSKEAVGPVCTTVLDCPITSAR